MTCDDIKNFQTLIVGTLGFSGVIITIVANRVILFKKYQRETQQKRSSLRAAIKAELEINLSTFEHRINNLKEPKNSIAYIHNKVFSAVYNSLLGNIGLLDDNEVKEIIRSYLIIEEVPALILLEHSKREGGNINDEIISISPEKREKVCNIHVKCLASIKEAIKAINQAAL